MERPRPCRVLRVFSSSRISFCTVTSSAEVISSQIRSRGAMANARAMAARWHCPPLT